MLRYLFLDEELDVVLEAGMLARLHGPAIRSVARRGAVVSLESSGGGFDFPFESRHAALEFHAAILKRMSTIWNNIACAQPSDSGPTESSAEG